MSSNQEELQLLRNKLGSMIRYINWVLQDYKNYHSPQEIRNLHRQKNELIAEIYKKDPDWKS